jgi:hypothetical protein
MKINLTLTLLALQAGYSWGQNAETAPVTQTDKQICLCRFELGGTSKRGMAGGLAGGAVGGAIAGKPTSYYSDAGKEAQQIYETTLTQSGVFQPFKNDHSGAPDSGKTVSLTDTAAKNGLYACVRGKSYWAARMGWNKQAAVVTKWELAGAGKCKFKMTTTATSKETHGKFPNGADPALKPVYLELVREDARQLLETLPKAMKKAHCTQ